MKRFLELLKEQVEMEVNVPSNDKEIKNPSFVFEINGNFSLRDLETLMQNNEQGLVLDTLELKINTKGLIGDSDYESFVQNVEKLKYLKFLR